MKNKLFAVDFFLCEDCYDSQFPGHLLTRHSAALRLCQCVVQQWFPALMYSYCMYVSIVLAVSTFFWLVCQVLWPPIALFYSHATEPSRPILNLCSQYFPFVECCSYLHCTLSIFQTILTNFSSTTYSPSQFQSACGFNKCTYVVTKMIKENCEQNRNSTLLFGPSLNTLVLTQNCWWLLSGDGYSTGFSLLLLKFHHSCASLVCLWKPRIGTGQSLTVKLLFSHFCP